MELNRERLIEYCPCLKADRLLKEYNIDKEEYYRLLSKRSTYSEDSLCSKINELEKMGDSSNELEELYMLVKVSEIRERIEELDLSDTVDLLSAENRQLKYKVSQLEKLLSENNIKIIE